MHTHVCTCVSCVHLHASVHICIQPSLRATHMSSSNCSGIARAQCTVTPRGACIVCARSDLFMRVAVQFCVCLVTVWMYVVPVDGMDVLVLVIAGMDVRRPRRRYGCTPSSAYSWRGCTSSPRRCGMLCLRDTLDRISRSQVIEPRSSYFCDLQ